MSPTDVPHEGELHKLMAAQHAILDELLAKAAQPDEIDEDAYRCFRERLLRHIRIEEKILLPMAERKRGTPLSIAARLRLDHGALAALLMVPPSAKTFHAIRAVLDAHNPLEEVAGGVYDQCDSLSGAESNVLLARIAATPAVPVSSWVDSPKVVAAAQRALSRAGYDPRILDAAESKSN